TSSSCTTFVGRPHNPSALSGTTVPNILGTISCSRNRIIDSDDENSEYLRTDTSSRNPDTTRIVNNDISCITKSTCGFSANVSIIPLIQKRPLSLEGFSSSQRCKIGNSLLPNVPSFVQQFSSKVFCGSFSKDGNFFITATQDKWLYIYRTHEKGFNLYSQMLARDVGWSVLDVAFSPDGNYFAYSSWADCLYQCHISGESLETLPLSPGVRRFCIFSLVFSNDGREIFGGANDKCIYIYDRECQQRVLRFESHDEDVNGIAFADDSSQVFYSVSDDGLCKVWDRRTINESNPRAVGVMAGHRDGITYVDSRGDKRYFITNSKDQSIKLWDIRMSCSNSAQQNIRRFSHDWDYRWQPVPQRLWVPGMLEDDTSVMTYYGHSVRKTLIRCCFSPPNTTGQRFICSGDSLGRVVIYDLLTGQVVRKMKGHAGCVRDISWHPYNHYIVTSSVSKIKLQSFYIEIC
ncbi:DDB1- and CUL4-associated factor 11, partial [Pogonomyrmex barbatus]|uniref:DDB1- and CUL4-associated factor 11 n=1 Tax=Pogonomyrmex barbatus TaxID=144034 RepID=A0A8N1S2L9_9HYME